MAKVLSKTGIDTNEAIIADYVNNTTDVLTGVDAYDITIAGSSTITGSLKVLGDITNTITGSSIITGSLKVLGDITNTEDLTTVGVITAQTKLQAIEDLDVTENIVTIQGNTILGHITNSPTTIKGNITGSGNITLASSVSASIIIGKANSLSFANTSGEIEQIMTKSSFPPGSVIGINAGGGNTSVEFTLPTPVSNAGLEYTFISNNSPSGGATTVSFSFSGRLNGIAICDDGTEDIEAADTLQFAATKFIKGTRVYCVSDGTIWHVTAFCLCDLADVSS